MPNGVHGGGLEGEGVCGVVQGVNGIQPKPRASAGGRGGMHGGGRRWWWHAWWWEAVVAYIAARGGGIAREGYGFVAAMLVEPKGVAIVQGDGEGLLGRAGAAGKPQGHPNPPL